VITLRLRPSSAQTVRPDTRRPPTGSSATIPSRGSAGDRLQGGPRQLHPTSSLQTRLLTANAAAWHGGCHLASVHPTLLAQRNESQPVRRPGIWQAWSRPC
ncbi:hypothetical protein T310_5147, partial [Rasamsonia emersonii CBS 393.64]